VHARFPVAGNQQRNPVRETAFSANPTQEAMSSRIDLPQGTLDLLILKSLSLGPQHGWAISERIRQVTSALVDVPQGSLYPALHRLQRRGWIRARWGTSDNNRRAKYYQLTRRGEQQLAAETAAWEKLTQAVELVLRMA
jgi:transcriptional regulator